MNLEINTLYYHHKNNLSIVFDTLNISTNQIDQLTIYQFVDQRKQKKNILKHTFSHKI